MRVFLIVFMLSLFSLSVSAEETPVTDEYQNVPPGLLLKKKDIGDVVVVPKEEVTTEEPAQDVMTMEEVVAAYKAGKYDLVAPRLKVSAENGSPQAEELLGIMYHNGQGMEKNTAEAVKWLTAAAEKARPLAQHHLAIMYYMGDGVPKNTTTALMWLHLAILYYPEGAEKQRAKQDRDNVYLSVSRRDKDRALELARAWLEKRGDELLLDLQ